MIYYNLVNNFINKIKNSAFNTEDLKYITFFCNFKWNIGMKTTKKKLNNIFSRWFENFSKKNRVIKGVDSGMEFLENLRILENIDDPVIVVFPLLSDVDLARTLFPGWSKFLDIKSDFILLPESQVGEAFISESEAERVRAIYLALDGDSSIFITSASGLLSPIPNPESIQDNSFSLISGTTFVFADLISKLVEMDYDDEYEVRVHGEFSRRGGIVDIFSPAYDYPVRIEFFGDVIEKIRLFSPDTQRTFKEISEYTVIQREVSMERVSDWTFFDCFKDKKATLIINSPERCKEHIERFSEQEIVDNWNSLIENDQISKYFILDSADSSEYDDKSNFVDSRIRRTSDLIHGNDIPDDLDSIYSEWHKQLAVDRIQQWINTDYCVSICGSFDSSIDHIKSWCKENSINHKALSITQSFIPYGVTIPSEKIAILTEKELFSSTQHHLLPTFEPEVDSLKKELTTPLSNDEQEQFSNLECGDYAVHLNHGICIYHGIVDIDTNGNDEEMFKLEFADDLIMYLPIRQANLISKYIGAKRDIPTLNKMGGKRWLSSKISAARDIKNMAIELLGVQASRMNNSGHAYPQDDLWQHIFEEAFPYSETPDQLKATAEIKKDMMKSQPMDRLLCGDVGYGKTEVAMRACFKAVMEGKQVAILVPTTILAQQHYYTFRDRFIEHPVIIDALSRFKSKKEQRISLEKLREGKIDIIIGTHRLVQSDVEFANLGLVIIDEEQRFGVGHKERFKQFRSTVDVLTMTATPIPRTLYMSMTGLRNLSTIMTPPSKRLPVRTFVSKEDDSIAKKAIKKEVSRGGQVYYLHNRVKTIHQRSITLANLIPDAKFAVAHGQMDERELEAIMAQFLDGKIDVLVCTTIIESGLDIPNANTIIIDRADRFGLSELYQLRGRVGRWHRQAFSYLFLPKDSILTGNARKRIAAIRRYTELGAGFRLALRDLEIRGAGNILGATQSGHINSIGFELYCQLLRSTVSEQGKGNLSMLPQVDLDIDFISYSSNMHKDRISASLPESYIPSEIHRVNLYKRLANAISSKDLDKISSELKDKFGKLPECVKNIIFFSRLKLALALSGYTNLIVKDSKIYMKCHQKTFKINGKIPILKEKRLKMKFKELFTFIKNQ